MATEIKYVSKSNHPCCRSPDDLRIRGVETVTNNSDSVPYWRVMMAAHGVRGYARYEP